MPIREATLRQFLVPLKQCRGQLGFFLKKQHIMNSTILSSVDFGFFNSAFEYVDMGSLVLFLLSFLTLMSFGLLFLFVVTTVLLLELLQDRMPAFIRLGKVLYVISN